VPADRVALLVEASRKKPRDITQQRTRSAAASTVSLGKPHRWRRGRDVGPRRSVETAPNSAGFAIEPGRESGRDELCEYRALGIGFRVGIHRRGVGIASCSRHLRARAKTPVTPSNPMAAYGGFRSARGQPGAVTVPSRGRAEQASVKATASTAARFRNPFTPASGANVAPRQRASTSRKAQRPPKSSGYRHTTQVPSSAPAYAMLFWIITASQQQRRRKAISRGTVLKAFLHRVRSSPAHRMPAKKADRSSGAQPERLERASA